MMFGSVHGVTVLRKPSEDCEAVSPCAILRFKSIAILGLVIALALAVGVGRARADAPAEAAHIPGFDISWPQCPTRAFPPGPVAFAVIGLNGGRPYTSNPCFAEQYRWAQRMTRNPAIYINLDFPKPGRMEALEGPYGRCAETDTWCRAYNWGYGLGADVAARARAAGVPPGTWWLDVEVGNYWSSEPEMNAQVVRGVVDYMREKRLPIGIYGTPYQWRLIAGSAYNPRSQIWTAGAQGPEQAVQRCTDKYAFGGGHVQMVQYETHGFDSNYICPGTDLHLSHMLNSYTSGAQGPASRGTAVVTAASANARFPFWTVIPGITSSR